MSILDPQARAAMLAEVYPDETAAQAEELFRGACEEAQAVIRRNARMEWEPMDEEELVVESKRIADVARERRSFAWQRYAVELAAAGLEPNGDAWREAWFMLEWWHPANMRPPVPLVAMERRGPWVDLAFGPHVNE